MDVFSMQSPESGQSNLDLFSEFLVLVGGYNSSSLNASQALINQSIPSIDGGTVEPGYVFAILSSSSSLSNTATVM